MLLLCEFVCEREMYCNKGRQHNLLRCIRASEVRRTCCVAKTMEEDIPIGTDIGIPTSRNQQILARLPSPLQSDAKTERAGVIVELTVPDHGPEVHKRLPAIRQDGHEAGPDIGVVPRRRFVLE